MTPPLPLPRTRVVVPPRRRADVIVVGLAMLAGSWLGLTAPRVSPVAAPPPGQTTTTAVASVP